jgi:ureidoacrylate peracid hydrolase
VFSGIDTSICVETSLREGFNIGYDVMIISDATASSNQKFYETTLERGKDYYGLVMDSEWLEKRWETLDKIRKGQIDLKKVPEDAIKVFLVFTTYFALSLPDSNYLLSVIVKVFCDSCQCHHSISVSLSRHR